MLNDEGIVDTLPLNNIRFVLLNKRDIYIPFGTMRFRPRYPRPQGKC